MKLLVVVALSVVSACALDASRLTPEGALNRYFSLAEKMQAVLDQGGSESAIRKTLTDLAAACCHGDVQSRLNRWIADTNLRSSQLTDDLQSMRPIAGQVCEDPVFSDDSTATVLCRYATSESFSLARNLRDVRDLYARYPISNIPVDDLTDYAARQPLPELVEYVIIAQRTVDLRIQRVNRDWRVTQADVRVHDATVDVRAMD